MEYVSGIFSWELYLVVYAPDAYGRGDYIYYHRLFCHKKYLRGRGVCHREHETPLEILKKRYARGEITRDEFQRMKEDLDR